MESGRINQRIKNCNRKGIGIIGMKTCSGGPYSLDNKSEPSLPQAVQWVLQQEYIHAAAVAMANFKEVDEHVMACRKFIRKEG